VLWGRLSSLPISQSNVRQVGKPAPLTGQTVTDSRGDDNFDQRRPTRDHDLMNQFNLPEEFRVVAVAVVATLLFLVIARFVVRAALIRLGWFTGNVRVPWRMSLAAIVVLTVLAAGVFAVFRKVPDIAAVAMVLVVFVWLPIARFLEFRRSVAARSNRQLENLARERQRDATGSGRETE
jgi:hypothetical protein